MNDYYECPYCCHLIEIADGWAVLSDDMPCPQCNNIIHLSRDEDGTGEGWFYFEKGTGGFT